MENSNNTIETIIQLFGTLSKSNQEIVKNKLNGLDEFIRQIQPRTVSCCPHCHSTHFVKNGNVNKKQRYLCRGENCGKSFMASTGTIFFSTKKNMDSLEKYLMCIFQFRSLRQCAKICKMNLKTAFIWRHKILDLLSQIMADLKLNGVVQADETYFRVSYKGNHKRFKLPRPAHHNGSSVSVRGLSKAQVCVATAVNLANAFVGKVASLGKPTTKQIKKVLDQRIEVGSTFISDAASIYQRLAKDMQLFHIELPAGHYTNGAYNLQKMNSFHSHLKRIVNRLFMGVATKYLNNYIVYYGFIQFMKDSHRNKKSILCEGIQNEICYCSWKNISQRPAIPL